MTYTRAEFIKKLAPAAVATMGATDISAALTLAQGALESRNGNSGLTVKANNLFGVKGKGDAGSIVMRTAEQDRNGREYFIDASFARYSSWAASVEGRSRLLLNGVSWNRDIYKGVLGKRGREAAKAIQAAGYATDKAYAALLISIMDTYNLYQYDGAKAVEDVKNDSQKAPEVVELPFVINGADAGDAYVIDGVSFVQLRKLAELFKFPVGWDNDRKVATIRGRDVTTFQVFEGRVYVQLRPIAEAYGAEAKWDAKSRLVALTSKR